MRAAELTRRLPTWFWRRPIGIVFGAGCAVVLTGIVQFIARTLFVIPNPALLFILLILGVAYGWGGRAGFATALASFLLVWYYFVAPAQSFAFGASSDWTRLILIGVTYGAMTLVGDAFRRVRRANIRLQETVERLNAIIVSIPDGVMILDRGGDLVQSNAGMTRLFEGEVPLTIDQRREAWQTRLPNGASMGNNGGPTFAALAGEITTGYEVSVRTATGRVVPVSVSGAPIRGHGGRIDGAVVVFHDITEVRRLQQVKDDFLSIASHELKTPLTSLRGYAQLLRQRLPAETLSDPRAARYLATIDNQVRRMGELVDTLLDLSRLDAGRLQLRRQPFDLVLLVREIVAQLGELSPRHPMTLNAEPAQIIGDWDRERIEQIVVNLLTNAIRYSPDGGNIWIEINIGAVSDTAGHGPYPHSAREAFVRVRDEGVGIAADQLETIFGRFHRVHDGALVGYAEAQRGMGLGLFISR
ncbi:MAG TPA: histidine kinase dimerization/phospho-acceptor domain-containing protein, partial [Thermomicrobiales bacterium]